MERIGILSAEALGMSERVMPVEYGLMITGFFGLTAS